MMILIWVLLGFAIYYLVKNGKIGDGGNKNKENAVEILKMRYINGEIDEEAYKRALKVLKD